jgi:hypothetical protein
MNATSDGQKTSGFQRENQVNRHRKVSCEGLQNRFGECRFSRYLRGTEKAKTVRAGTAFRPAADYGRGTSTSPGPQAYTVTSR